VRGGGNDNFIGAGDYNFNITHDNIKRYYLLHIPKSYNAKNSPLILALHGGMGTAETQKEYYGLVEKSDKEGFIIAFPNGASRFPSGGMATWNAGNCCAYAVQSKSDDVGFIKKVISDIKSKAKIDKIYAIGMSNGGMMSYRLACDMSDTFTAIASVAGTDNYDNCNPKKAISIMHIHSLIDSHVLFDGGCGPDCNIKAETEFTSVPDTISKWVTKNNCNNNPERVFDNNGAYCDLYTGCKANTQVKLCVTDDGGHSWPGAQKSPVRPEQKIPSQKISANNEIWNFFSSIK
jgi:polyhydroxybutyrate depolymerase